MFLLIEIGVYRNLYLHTAITLPRRRGVGGVMTNYFDGSRRGRDARYGASGAKLIKRRKTWKSRNAVSEIIGNMLILAITVIMFSGIFVFVASMDGPAEKVYTNFIGSVLLDDTGVNVKEIKIINKGGNPLEDHRTAIYLFVSDTAKSLKITDSDPTIGTTWNTGSTWIYKDLSGTTSDAEISVMIVDVQANTVVWEAKLQGADDSLGKPIIGSRGITSTNQPVAGSVYVGDFVRFFAHVSLPYGSIEPREVYVNASRLMGSGGEQIYLKNDGSGVYWSEASYPTSQSWNGKVVTFHADVNGETVSANFVVRVITGGSGPDGPLDDYDDDLVNGDYPSDASGGQSGGGNSRLGTTFYYIRNAVTNEITRNFQPGDKVMIEFYSNSMMNLALENSFEITHPYNGESLPQSKFSSAFTYGGLHSGFYRYVFTFTAPSDPLIYPLQILMKDYYGTNLNVKDSITVGGANYPIIEIYKWDEKNNSLIKTKDFTPSDRIYLKIVTLDTDSDITKVQVGTITISDYSGRYLIKSVPTVATKSPNAPAYDAPMSSLFKTSAAYGSTDSAKRVSDSDSAGVYTIYIELKAADLSWWLAKKNSYTLSLSFITESPGETYQNIATQFNVTAPLSLTDIVASIGTGAFTWSASGAQWENSKLVWFEKGTGSSAWGLTTIDGDSPAGPLAMALTDMNNDGIKDLLVAFQDPAVSIAWYRGLDVNGKSWSEMPNIIQVPFDAHPGEQANGGSSDRGLNNEDVLVYHNSQGFRADYKARNEICVAMEIGDFDGDGFTDIVASFAHAVVYTTASSRDDAERNPGKSQGMFFNRGVYVYWGSTDWKDRTTLGSTMDWASSSSTIKANDNNNPAILDLAVGDFNKDGCDDIVGVDETGKTYIWMSAWKESLNAPDRRHSTFASKPIMPSTVGGYDPWERMQRMPRVEVAQMDNQGYLDIIRTSTKNNAIYIIHTTGKDNAKAFTYPTKEYGTNELKPTATITHMDGGLSPEGWIKDLMGIDGDLETITEVYLESDLFTSVTGGKGEGDTTGRDLDLVKTANGATYNVDYGKTLHIRHFSTGTSDMGKTIIDATLNVKFSVDTGYDGLGEIQWFKEGDPSVKTGTGITPTGADHEMQKTYDLRSNGFRTAADINALNIEFKHTGSVGAVKIDAIWLEITYVEGMYLEWQFEIPNLPDRSIHTLEVTAHCNTEDESYKLMYSPDNMTWFSLGNIWGTEQRTYTYSLFHTSSSKYYLKIVDNNQTKIQSDNRSVCLNMVRITHYSPGVEWLASNMQSKTVDGLGSRYVTAIAIGDVGSNGAISTAGVSHAIDGYNDVVVATSWVGGTKTHTLLVLTGKSDGGLDGQMSIDTSGLAARAGAAGTYNSAAIALGDFDADYDLDIVLIIGFAPGKSGTPSIPTIWTYINEPQIGSWNFEEAPLSALGGDEAGINVVTGYVNLSLFFPFIGLAGIVVASITIERLAKRKR